MRFLKDDGSSSQDLSSAALDYTTSIAKACKIDMITIKASVNITETITITLDSAKGANYDTVLVTRDLISEKNFVFRPEGDLTLQPGDQLKIECTDANNTGTVYVIVKPKELG